VDPLLHPQLPEVGAVTRTSRALTALYGLVMLGAVSAGGQFIGTARWLHAAIAYAVAGILLVALLREVGRAIPPGDYTDDVQEEAALVGDAYDPDQPRPRRMGRLRAARAARRELQDMPCRCERYWSTIGLAHDPWCALYEESSA